MVAYVSFLTKKCELPLAYFFGCTSEASDYRTQDSSFKFSMGQVKTEEALFL